MKSRGAINLALTTLLLLTAAPLVRSQTITASLGGTILDPSGAAVPNARIRIVHTATNVQTSLTAGSRGEFLAPSLQPGPYSLRVEATGFRTGKRGGIVLDVAQAARLDIALEVGSIENADHQQCRG